MRKINENYVYKEPEEITIQRNKIYKNQRNIEDFIELIEENSQEMKIHKLIKEDLSFMADYLAEPYEEYICFSNYPIGDKIADFVVRFIV